MVKLAKENINDYLTISADTAQTAIELMKFYVETKKLLYGFPLTHHPTSEEVQIGPSASQETNTARTFEVQNSSLSNRNRNSDNTSVLSNNSKFSSSISSCCPLNGETMDAAIEKNIILS